MRVTRIANAIATAAIVTGGVGLLGFLVAANLGWETAAVVCAWTVLTAGPVTVAAVAVASVAIWKHV